MWREQLRGYLDQEKARSDAFGMKFQAAMKALSSTPPAPIAPPPPAVDTGKMNGAQLIDHALRQQDARRVKEPQPVVQPFNAATASTGRLLGEGMKGRQVSRLPQEAAFAA